MPTPLAAPRAPYSLEPNAFSFPAMAAMVGRAPLGGQREAALACFLVSRIVRDALGMGDEISPDQLRQRVISAKHWLGSAAIPAAVRLALSRLVDATCSGDAAVLKLALDGVMAVTADHFDPGARLELGRLAQAIAG